MILRIDVTLIHRYSMQVERDSRCPNPGSGHATKSVRLVPAEVQGYAMQRGPAFFQNSPRGGEFFYFGIACSAH